MTDGYSAIAARLHPLGEYITAILRDILTESGTVVHSVAFRVKEHDSARRKMLADPESFKEYSDLHDMLGVRVITLFDDDLDKAEIAITRAIEVDPHRSSDRQAKYAPNEFGYRSRHYVGCLSEQRLLLEENHKYSGLVVEIQLRSLLQHAWAEIEHDLGYKPQRPVTPTLRRKFARMAALMELADDEFSRLRRDVEVTERVALENSPGESALADDAELTVASLQAFIKRDMKLQLLDRTVAAALHRTLLPEGRDQRKFAAHVLDRCLEVGWSTVRALRVAIESHSSEATSLVGAADSGWTQLLDPDGHGLRPGFSVILAAYLERLEGGAE